MVLIDSHAHIYLEQYENDLDEIMYRSKEAGVEKIFMPNIDCSTISSMLHVHQRFPDRTFPMIGLHPTSVGPDFKEELLEIGSWLEQGNFVAVGEIGTDLYWDDKYWKQQQEALQLQLEWATKFKLPAILHSRESLDQNIEIVTNQRGPDLKGIFHCFTGDLKQAEKIIVLNFMIGLGGVITFKNSNMGDVVREIPLENIVLETDSPYLAPTPYRGKRNEPSYLLQVAEQVAEIKSVSVEQVAKVTTRNALEIFSI